MTADAKYYTPEAIKKMFVRVWLQEQETGCKMRTWRRNESGNIILEKAERNYTGLTLIEKKPSEEHFEMNRQIDHDGNRYELKG